MKTSKFTVLQIRESEILKVQILSNSLMNFVRVTT